MFKVFLDGAKHPVIECQAYGSRDVDGSLHLIADGTLIPVTEKLIVCEGDPLPDESLKVVDVLIPNHVLLSEREAKDAKVAAAEKKAEEARIAALAANANAAAAQGMLAAVNGAVAKRD